MSEQAKRLLLRLKGLRVADMPEVVLHQYGIRKDGIVAVDLPRFPRVSDVKRAVEKKLSIPPADQILRGPLPLLTELSCDWAHLSSFGVLPGLCGAGAGVAAGGHATATDPGELFSTASPMLERFDDDKRVVSDILELSTRLDIGEFFPGGSHYWQSLRHRQMQSLLWQLLRAAIIFAVIFYILWLIPGYELPKVKNPQTNMPHLSINNTPIVGGEEDGQAIRREEL